MDAVHVVVHTEKSSQLLLDKLLKKFNIGWVAYRHPPDGKVKRPHFHALLVHYKGTRETLRTYIKEIFSVERGSFFTTNTYKINGEEKPIDFGLITYMSKGKYKYESVNKFSDEFIEEYEDKWVEPTKKTIDLHSTEVNYVDPNPKKYVKWDYIKMAVSQCVERQAESASGVITFGEIFDIYKKILIDHSQKTGKYKMADDIFTIMLQLGNYESHMRNQVAKVLGFMDLPA